MPRSLSKSQIDKLGERLAAAPVATDEDLVQLEQLRSGDYANAMDRVVAILRSIGVVPGEELTARLKTNATIIDKLRRGTKLSSMQDLAGIRITRRMSLGEQDELVASITRRFAGPLGEPLFKISDRRAKPSFGYRAVHVIVQMDGCPVEVQVRTVLQHFWAQTFELIADIPAFGRGIRYGDPPAIGHKELVRFLENMRLLSVMISRNEGLQEQVAQLPKELAARFEVDLSLLAKQLTDILESIVRVAGTLRT